MPKTISVIVDQETYEALQFLAKAKFGLTVSDVVREAIATMLEDRDIKC